MQQAIIALCFPFDFVNTCSIIPRLHDQAGSTNCYMLVGRASLMFTRCLLDRVNGVLLRDWDCRLTQFRSPFIIISCVMFI